MNSVIFLDSKAFISLSEVEVKRDKTSQSFCNFIFCHSNSFSTEQDGELS